MQKIAKKIQKKERVMANKYREEIKEFVEKHGFDSLSEYDKMEYVLFWVFSRVDTKILAKALVDTFGSFAGILDCPAGELMKIDGIGPDSAYQLSHFKEFFTAYSLSKNLSKELRTLPQIAKFYNSLLEYKPLEQMLAVALNKNYQIITYKSLAIGMEDNVAIDKSELVSFATNAHARYVIIGHNHPNGSCEPSKMDYMCTNTVKAMLNSIKISLFDHIIVGTNGVFSFTNVKFITRPFNEENILDYLESVK